MGDDCNDADVNVSPAELEVCFNAVDEDCDGLTLCDMDSDDADLLLTGESVGDGAGGSVGTGTASLSTADAKRRGVASSDYAGFTVSGAGDVNNDGYDDVIIGAYGYGTYGAAFLELGPITGTASLSAADARIEGSSGLLSKAMTGGGDVDGDGDGDGDDDLAIANPEHDGGGTDAGEVILYMGPLSGTSTDTSADVTYTGSGAGDQFGISLGFVGAQDGTVGESDLFIGAMSDDDGGSAAGSAYLYTTF